MNTIHTIRQLISTKPCCFNSVPPDTLVIEALNLMASLNLSYLVVLEGSEYKGIFTEKDYARNVILKGRASNSTEVKEVMTTDFPVVDPNDTSDEAMRLLNVHRTRYLLAFEEGVFKAVITIHDLVREVAMG